MPIQDQSGRLPAVAGCVDCVDGLLRLGDVVPDLHLFSAVLFSAVLFAVDQCSDICQVPGDLRECKCTETNEQVVRSVRLVPGRKRYGDERAGSWFLRWAAFRFTRRQHKVIDGCLAVDRMCNALMATASAKFAEVKRFDHFTLDTQRLRHERLVHRRYARLCISEEGIRGRLTLAMRYAFVGHLRNARNTAAVIELLSIITRIMPEVRRARCAINRHHQRAGSATKQQGPPNKATPNVGYGLSSDVGLRNREVCFTPVNGHAATA